ncbi:TonB-dependent receptor [Rufibacter immobilis]|uniref:TonB-dependent receptor n=1 Tax=Rufibacter immobilis TaxID=1348778 RepID=A0A3M9MX17_9BACT|nr:TonB-dependent receptor [Rufibacter immobilis]RNI29423.1 TonB-dependent receptor [Rufibacter immobilis]
MKRLILLFAVLLSVLHYTAQAQNRIISGRVTSATDGTPLPGVSVVVKGTTTGTSTDANGRYELSVPTPATLTFTYLGFDTREATVGTNTTVDVQLAESTRSLGEVVVVGYGTQERREVTGATAKVTAEAIENVPVVGVDQALQGRAAGVQISQNSGTPGGGVSVRIRGASSISASNQPLYVVDGVPLTTGDFSQIDFGGQGVNALSDLNPADIESMDILKDASAAAIYGSRAANGVVLITTKRGRANKTTANINAYYGIQNMWRKPDYLNADEYAEIMTEAYVNDGRLDPGATFEDFLDYYYGGVDFEPTNTDWIDQVTRDNAAISSYELSVSGGDLKTRYYLSGNYFDQQGIIIGSRYQRYSGRLNLDHTYNEKLSFSAGLQISRAENNRIVGDNTVVGPFANAQASSPIWPVYYEDGTYTQPNYYYTNPVAEGRENDAVNTNFRTLANATATYKILPKLTLNLRGGVDVLNLGERVYTANNYPGSAAQSAEGSATRTSSSITKRLLEATLDYRLDFGTTSNLSLLVGASTEKNTRDVTTVTGEGYPGGSFRFIGSATRINAGSNLLVPASLVSAFGRANLNLLDRYLIGVNFRADGSSRFGPDNRYGFFPSVSAGWRVLEEPFMPEIPALSELKLRASYGITGNQEIGDFAYLNLVTAAPYADRPGFAFTQLGNPELKWEETRQFNAGVDLGLFSNRVNLALDYYIKNTEDLLFARPVPTQSGFGAYFSNIGSVKNQGFEVSLNTVNFTSENKGFTWSTDFNISFNRNEVKELYQGQDIFYGFGGNSLVLREGEPIGTFYGFKTDGIFSTNADVPASRAVDANRNGIIDTQAGDVNFRDISGDGRITDDDLTIIGNAQPDFVGGLTNNFSFRGFDLMAFFQFSVGNEIANPAMQYQQHLGANFLDDNMLALVKNRWQQEGDVTDVPRAIVRDENDNNRSNQDRFIYDGSYVRLKNLMLGYTLPTTLISPLKLRSVRLYVQAQNLVTWTDYPGFDPEVNFSGTSNTTLGVDFYTFPQARTITFGVNIGL